MDLQAEQQILRVFEVEATEHLQALNVDLLELERSDGARGETIARIQRAAHTLKGTAAAAGLTRIEHLMHLFESCVHAVSQLRGELAEPVDLLCSLLDAAEAEVHVACSGTRPATETRLPSATVLQRVFGSALDASLLGVLNVDADVDTSSKADSAQRDGDGPMVRVATSKVDRLMANVEELVQVKAGGAERARELARLSGSLESISKALASLLQKEQARSQRGAASSQPIGHELTALKDRVDECALSGVQLHAELRRHSHLLSGLATSLQDDIRSVRMVPAHVVFSGFARMVRDVARRQDKLVTLVVEGGDTEVDRDLLETLKAPVMHLLRNAVAHGIESPEQRERAGKPQEGRVCLAVHSGAAGLELDVTDDGRGIDAAVIRGALIARGTLASSDANALSDEELQAWIFRSGFSTATSIDEVAGRGMGLDVVHSSVERCGGSVRVSSELGRSTRFALKLPLNLTTVRALLVRAGGHKLALPVSGVIRIVRVERSAVHTLTAGPAIEVDGRAVALSRLSAVLRLADEASTLERAPAVIIGSGVDRVGLLVDAIDGEDELIVKSLGEHLRGVPFVAGAAVLASGQIAPVLSTGALVRQLVTSPGSARVFAAAQANEEAKKRVLIVDDSITTRTLEKSILEAVGYDVTVATDGQDALGKLRGASFDLILSDVQMPRMDGIELVTRVRRDDKLRAIKIVLVSSLNGDEDRRRGLTAGADAYLGKSEFRQDLLLETLERLI